jgi:hypothetical protein
MNEIESLGRLRAHYARPTDNMRKLRKELINFVAFKALELSIKSFHHTEEVPKSGERQNELVMGWFVLGVGVRLEMLWSVNEVGCYRH